MLKLAKGLYNMAILSANSLTLMCGLQSERKKTLVSETIKCASNVDRKEEEKHQPCIVSLLGKQKICFARKAKDLQEACYRFLL